MTNVFDFSCVDSLPSFSFLVRFDIALNFKDYEDCSSIFGFDLILIRLEYFGIRPSLGNIYHRLV